MNSAYFCSQIKIFSVKIGSVDLGEKPLLLAPMEDVTDPSFRYLCKRFGADMMFTEFVNSDGLIRDAANCQHKLNIYEHERPIGIQLYGHLIDSMVEACKLASAANPDVIDINFGCPVKKIANRGAGSGMMKDIPKMVEMTRQIVNATHIPVTVKTRLGWDDDSKFIVSIAEQLQDVGIQALTIHGRTRAQLYKGNADWALIGEVKANPRMHIPIIGNGDVDSPEKAVEMFSRYGVDGIMIGRATYGRPWIFQEIKHFMNNGVKITPFTVEQKVVIAKEHLQKSIEFKGERRGILELRRHLTCYFKGLPNFKELRLKLVTTDSPSYLYELLDIVAERYAGFTQDESINPSPWI
jgi:nifR3 family TIM-barrel protein